MVPCELDDVTEAELRALVEQQCREGIRMEYHREIPEDRNRLRRDACAFANTQGGDIVIGIQTSDDAPTG